MTEMSTFGIRTGPMLLVVLQMHRLSETVVCNSFAITEEVRAIKKVSGGG